MKNGAPHGNTDSSEPSSAGSLVVSDRSDPPGMGLLDNDEYDEFGDEALAELDALEHSVQTSRPVAAVLRPPPSPVRPLLGALSEMAANVQPVPPVGTPPFDVRLRKLELDVADRNAHVVQLEHQQDEDKARYLKLLKVSAEKLKSEKARSTALTAEVTAVKQRLLKTAETLKSERAAASARVRTLKEVNAAQQKEIAVAKFKIAELEAHLRAAARQCSQRMATSRVEQPPTAYLADYSWELSDDVLAALPI